MSPRVAKYIQRRLDESGKAKTELLDLFEYNFPVMEERLHKRDDPPSRLKEFSEKIAAADAVVIISPEYNNGYPAVLKNAIDYLLPEFKRKPVGIVTVSNGQFGGLNALSQLRMVLISMGSILVPARFPVTKVGETFDENGNPLQPWVEKTANNFLKELFWLSEAVTEKMSRDNL